MKTYQCTLSNDNELFCVETPAARIEVTHGGYHSDSSSSSSDSHHPHGDEHTKCDCRDKGQQLKEVARVTYDRAESIVAEVFNFGEVAQYGIESFTGILYNSDLGLADRITNLYSPTQFDSMDEFDVRGTIFSKQAYLDYVQALYNLWKQHGNRPYAGLSGCGIFYSSKYPERRFLISAAVNGTVILDDDRLAKAARSLSYDEAVQLRVVIKFIPSTWNIWHEYVQVGDYIYHIQEDNAVSNGLQIIDMSDPYNPRVVKGDNLTFGDDPRWHDRYPGNFQGAHFIQHALDRPYVWINGVTPFDVWRNDYVFMFPTNFTCEPVGSAADNHVHTFKAEQGRQSVQAANDEETNPRFLAMDPGGNDTKSHPYGRIVRGFKVSDPVKPKVVAEWYRVYAHDAKILKRGQKYYLVMSAVFNESVYFIDVTRPESVHPTNKLMHFCLPKLQGGPNLVGNQGFEAVPHSVYFSEGGNIMYLFNENFDVNMYVFDIRDLHKIRIINEFRLPRYGTIMHEARREYIPSKKIDRLVTSAYDAGGFYLDIYKKPAQPELIAWHESTVATFATATVQPNVIYEGYWALIPLGKDDYSFGGVMALDPNEDGVYADASTVLLQLVPADACHGCAQTNERYTKTEMLEAIALHDNVHMTNDVKLDYLTRLKWFGCRHKKGSCKHSTAKSYQVDCSLGGH